VTHQEQGVQLADVQALDAGHTGSLQRGQAEVLRGNFDDTDCPAAEQEVLGAV
jgi:hypothetical protein